MAIGGKYKEGGHRGFDPRLENGDDCGSHDFEPGTHAMEVVLFDVFESKAGDDYMKVWLHAGDGRVLNLFKKITENNGWVLSRTVQAIFRKALPVDDVQTTITWKDQQDKEKSRVCTPRKTVSKALGMWVNVDIVESDYPEPNVDIVSSADMPEGLKAMFNSDHVPTGHWATNATELFGEVVEDDDDGDDDW